MVAVVSHDLRNPLSNVIGAAELLAEFELSPEKRSQQIRTIRRAGDSMRRLVEDLLDVARIDASGIPVDPKPEPLGPIFEDVVLLMRRQAESKGVTLEVAGADDELPSVLADRERLVQALANLVSNAIRFTDEGGSVRIEPACEGERVCLRVADTGCGIGEEDLQHLFDRFWQAEGGEKGGAGLGLTIVKGIVDAHGGEIQVRSEPGGGTTFEIVLERGPQERPKPSTSQAFRTTDA